MFSEVIIAERSAGGLDESGINGNAFIDSQTLVFKLAQNFGIELIHGFFGESAFHPVRYQTIMSADIVPVTPNTLPLM